MRTLANSGDSDDMGHNAALHQGLHCLLKQKLSSEKKIQFHLACSPWINIKELLSVLELFAGASTYYAAIFL